MILPIFRDEILQDFSILVIDFLDTFSGEFAKLATLEHAAPIARRVGFFVVGRAIFNLLSINSYLFKCNTSC